jgi:Calcineurin-like phosphoesterase
MPNVYRKGAAALLLGLLVAWTASAADFDAPYVMRDATGKLEAWMVDATPEGPQKRVQPLTAKGKFTVAAVGQLPAFSVRIRPPAETAPDEITTRKPEPLFVVADTHGEYEILAAMLTSQHIIDARLHWSFARGHLVVLGDVFDRGEHQTEILWLLYALEEEARKAGGGVDFVIGNHEAMTLGGDHRYLNPKYTRVARALGVPAYSQLFSTRSVLGQWLRTRATVLKINGLLCLHGGISPELVARAFTLQEINVTVRSVMSDGAYVNDVARQRATFLFGDTGPLWYRGYFPGEAGAAAASASDVDLALRRFGADRMLVGHTRVPTITSLYDGKVIAVQVYPQRDAAGTIIFEALSIRDGAFLRARPDGTTEPLL